MAKAKVKTGTIFERREKKYLLTKVKFNLLMAELEKYMTVDEYGLHTIHTVYYDTDDFDVIRHSVSKPKFKEKLRLRSYGQAEKSSPVYLELKKKVAGVTYKRRVALDYQTAQNYLKYGRKPSQMNQVFKEIDYYMQQQVLKPKVLISYDRLALSGLSDPDFRITFDQNIRYSLSSFDLTAIADEYETPLVRSDEILMEVKILGAFPLEISQLFSKLAIFQNKFTKYGNVYQWILYPEWEKQKLNDLSDETQTIKKYPQEELHYVKQYHF
ncbi:MULTISPECIES: polyphosphate polymerase domain-containing protein [unclassified Enterococcus]|uniref:polyphosphate polymerase domain-containing protein n=1 Tax=unclassified Enterococcus TaxID=2608891 RepID=UPI001554E0B7|nr:MULTISPECIES: polyphosphate polymerase domain-containing protein [unclassified Enterococcus]MBS7578102.1 polyphosphate polymerase domain-containing protein [Enterococcus sp. MMGLQ5-2]MBS7585362.1 polyphosphate polymerase domain-containing protein [Enterococcus sp. MMGLQ5-1]NPD13219.1 polyphosphate polymerase domain-containing protein [Enterococcus sp. MMGLQ5-1]NPD37933.1 polyphosphate polymerase domain-containing protein [Enterococcus sp. MMGLQ5-2]